MRQCLWNTSITYSLLRTCSWLITTQWCNVTLHRTQLGKYISTWWRHQMETFFAWLTFCVGNSPVTGEFPTQRPVTRSFDVFFDLRLNKQLSKQSWGWWFETPSRSLWRQCNVEFESDFGFATDTITSREVFSETWLWDNECSLHLNIETFVTNYTHGPINRNGLVVIYFHLCTSPPDMLSMPSHCNS